MKIGLFADPHYSTEEVVCATRRPRLSFAKIGEAIDAFRKAGVELIICLGDLINAEQDPAQNRENLAHIGILLRASGIKTLCIMGNHDAFCVDKFRFHVLTGLAPTPIHKKYGDVDIILLDANFYKNGKAYDGTEGDWTDTMVPAEEVEWLKRELGFCGDKTYVFSHQLLDYSLEQHHVIENAEKICAILESSGKVRGVYQGHYHPGGENIHGGIPYVTVPAMCEEYENAYQIIEV